MALVFVAKSMNVAAPVGRIKLYQLPELPSGLTRVHLLRGSLAMMSINLVDGEKAAFSEVHRGTEPGNIEYNETNVFTEGRGTGWEVPDWEVPLVGGMTWMVVADWDFETDNNFQFGTLSSHAASITFRGSGVRAYGHDGSSFVYTEASLSEIPEQPFMGFSQNDESGLLYAYVPHTKTASDELSYSPGSIDTSGLLVGVPSGNYDNPQNNRQYMIAEWSRRLSDHEMDAAYTALKPWLLSWGVEIA